MLDRIVAAKRRELAEAVGLTLEELTTELSGPAPPSFRAALEKPGINVIAEVKYHSPSRGDFLCTLPPVEVARSYVSGGAAALSVLTDRQFFRGELSYLETIHEAQPEIPLLRKDFILSRRQVAEARAAGASAYLLIAACLQQSEMTGLMAYGVDLGLDPLVEVHDPLELETAVESKARIIGVNNRDLKTFEVRLQTSFDLARRLEGETGYILVSESGITERTQIDELRDAGFSAFLIGSYFMDSDDPGKRLSELLS